MESYLREELWLYSSPRGIIITRKYTGESIVETVRKTPKSVAGIMDARYTVYISLSAGNTVFLDISALATTFKGTIIKKM